MSRERAAGQFAPQGRYTFTRIEWLDRRNVVSTTWGLLLLGGFYPIYRAWRGSTGTTLRHAVVWSAMAWGSWCAAVLLGGTSLHYLALCLTACTGVAVLGARRPGVAAWNFVVIGLLAALCRPFLEGLGEPRLERGHLIFLGVVLAAGLLNYLPTRQAPAVVVLGTWCALDVAEFQIHALVVLPAVAPWLALACAPRGEPEDFNDLWRAHRDRFGFVWAQRLRDQLNRVAENAGWPVTLGWSGLRKSRPGEVPDRERLLAMLRALSTRFRTDTV
jgi:hypothetical protein